MSDDTAAIDGPALVRRLRELVFAWAGDPGNKEPLTSRDIQDTFKCLQAAADRLEHSTNERIRLTGELLAAKDTLRAHLGAPAVAPPAKSCQHCAEIWDAFASDVAEHGDDEYPDGSTIVQAVRRLIAQQRASSGPSSPRSPLCYVPSCANPATYHDEYGVPHCETHRHQSDPPASGSRVAPPGRDRPAPAGTRQSPPVCRAPRLSAV
jgi:hypothetical protein